MNYPGNYSDRPATSGGFLVGVLRVVQPQAAPPAALQQLLAKRHRLHHPQHSTIRAKRRRR